VNPKFPGKEERISSPETVFLGVTDSEGLEIRWEGLSERIAVFPTSGEFHLNSNDEYEDTVFLSLPFSFRLYGPESQFLEIFVIDSIQSPDGSLLGIYRRFP